MLQRIVLLMCLAATSRMTPTHSSSEQSVTSAAKPEPAPHPVRIACVGDSNTVWGYPERLQEMLGDGWRVGNFGRGGATVIDGTDIVYANLPHMTEALSFEPGHCAHYARDQRRHIKVVGRPASDEL